VHFRAVNNGEWHSGAADWGQNGPGWSPLFLALFLPLFLALFLGRI